MMIFDWAYHAAIAARTAPTSDMQIEKIAQALRDAYERGVEDEKERVQEKDKK